MDLIRLTVKCFSSWGWICFQVSHPFPFQSTATHPVKKQSEHLLYPLHETFVDCLSLFCLVLFFFFKVLFCSLDWNIVLCHCILPNFLRRFYVLGIISSLSQSRRSSPTWEMSGGTQKCNLIWPQSQELHGCSLRGLWVLSCYSGAATATGHWWTGLAPGPVAVCWWVGPSWGWLWGFAEVHGTPTDRLEGEFQDGTNHCQYGSHWCFSPSWFLPLCQRL